MSLGGRFGRETSQRWVQGFHGHRNRDAEYKCWCCALSPLWSYVKEQVSKCHQPQADSLQRTGVLDIGTLEHLSQQSFRLEKVQFVPD